MERNQPVEVVMMAGSRLSLSEREEIRAGIERGESATEIACRLERHSSTVSREIAANGGREEYRAVNAHDRAVALAARPKPFKLVEDPQLASEVTELLVERKYSPQTCARMLSAAGKPISHETIYRACYQRGRGLDGDCWKSLPRRRQRRRHGGRQWGEAHSSPLGVITSVHRRHRIVADRSQAGHLEGDLLIGANNASAVLVTCERVSRKTFLETLPHGYGAEPVAMALCRLLDQIPPEMRRTLTWDQDAR
jgi:IS30 family transposase